MSKTYKPHSGPGSSSRGDRPRGPYTLWTDGGYEGWDWQDFETLEEALKAERHGQDFVITKPVSYTVTEVPEGK